MFASSQIVCGTYSPSLGFICSKISLRDSLAAQLEITLTKADSEQLARSIAEEQYSDLEKEKIMKELELKEMMARHRQDLSEKDITISSVCSQRSRAFTAFITIVTCRAKCKFNEILSFQVAFKK